MAFHFSKGYDTLDNQKKTPVLVFGKHYVAALDIARSLGLADYEVHLAFVASQKRLFNIVAKSKFVKKAIMLSEGNLDELADQLIAISEQLPCRSLLFPIDDFAVFVMDNFSDKLANNFILPVTEGYKKGHLSYLMDKHNQSAIASDCGLSTPLEWVINLSDDIIIPDDVVYPCFCKANQSVEGKKSEQRRCNSKDELYKHLCSLKAICSDRSALVQQFLNIQEEYIVIGACTSNQTVIAGIINKIESTRHIEGLILLGSLVPLEDVEGFKEIEANVKAFFKSCNYVGLFDLEFSRADGKIYFNELNLRASGIQYAVKKAGINLPLILVDSVLYNKFYQKSYSNVQYNRIFIKEKNILEDFLYKKISLKQIFSLYKKADDKLMSEKGDAAPSFWFYYFFFCRWLFPKLKRLFRR